MNISSCFPLVIAICIGYASVAAGITWPVDTVAPYLTSTFGPRCADGSAFHAGIDVRIDAGPSEVAWAQMVADGLIALIPPYNGPGWGGYDWTIIVDHTSFVSGYHHIERDDVQVWEDEIYPGNVIPEGWPLIPLPYGANVPHVSNDHLHYNTWHGIPQDATSATFHPMRIFGERGSMTVGIPQSHGSYWSAMVHHWGDLAKFEVGIGSCGPPCLPMATHTWDFEGNVRANMTRLYPIDPVAPEPSCTYGTESPYWGVSMEEDSFDDHGQIHFIWPAYAGPRQHIFESYTYAENVAGTRVNIDRPVGQLFRHFDVTQTGCCVRVEWAVSDFGAQAVNFTVLKYSDGNEAGAVPVLASQNTGDFSFDDCGAPGQRVQYRVTYVRDGENLGSRDVEVEFSRDEWRGRPVISRVFPNPTTGPTLIECALPAPSGEGRIEVYDLAGRRVKTLVLANESPGNQAIEWQLDSDNGTSVPAGCYFVRLYEGDILVQAKKLLVLR